MGEDDLCAIYARGEAFVVFGPTLGPVLSAKPHLLPLIKVALPADAYVDYAEFLAWIGVLVRLVMLSVPGDVL